MVGSPICAEIQTKLERTDDAIAQLEKTLNVAGAIDTRPQIEKARQQLKELTSQ